MKKLLLPLLLALLINAQAQIEKPKFGKISMEEMTMTKYEADTVAAALILFDDADCKFILNYDNDFRVNFTRHFRAKIFKKSAYDIAEISILLFGDGANSERITNLDAATYNLVNGKIVKTKLNSDQIFADKTKVGTNKKFAFPDVKEGSVIEYTYTTTSQYNFQLGWTFQLKHPSLWSQCTYEIPEYYIYHQTTRGYLPFDINISEQTSTTHLLNGTTQNVSTNTTRTVLAIKNVPAFIEEPNTDCDDNYIQSIQFELRSVQFPHAIRQDFSRTWESVTKELNTNDYFGIPIRSSSSNFIEESASSITANAKTDLEKAQIIYTFVQDQMSWNENNGLFISDGLKKAYEKKSGNTADINLLLIKMLRTANLSANPVIISTRANGVPFSYYPSISNYNSVIAKLDIGDKSYLLDASNDFCPFGILPARDLNGKGRAICEETSYDVDLNPIEKYRNVSSHNLAITEDGIIKGSIIESYNGYAAISIRNAMAKEKTTDDFIRKLQENNAGLTINKYAFANKQLLDKGVIDTLDVEITEQAEVIGDKIIFSPLLYNTIKKNIYTLENRQYPVSYNYPESELLIFNYTIPEGFEVESMPKSANMKLEDGSASITYSLQQLDKNIRITYKRNISKSTFLPDEYPNLKEFYDQIVRISSEKIVLKKTI